MNNGQKLALLRAASTARIFSIVVVEPDEPFPVAGQNGHEYLLTKVELSGGHATFFGYKLTHAGARKGMPVAFTPADVEDAEQVKLRGLDLIGEHPGDVAAFVRAAIPRIA